MRASTGNEKAVIDMADLNGLSYEDVSDLVPRDIFEILDYLAYCAKLNDGDMKWNEIARLKADLMQNWSWWRDVSIGDMAAVMADLGFSNDDIKMVADFIERRRAGRRLVPHASYRDMPFKHETSQD